ncbi:MAG: lipoyl(octanoyl) transferase LipB [Planctomycetaceae bacterium]|nr:lipoyl(octanoyl) transferase LipB [Planctomycetaceae bacterium]
MPKTPDARTVTPAQAGVQSFRKALDTGLRRYDDASTPVRFLDVGLIPYTDAWELQRRIHAEVVSGADSALILCEHPPVISLGSQTKDGNLLMDPETCRERGIDVVETDRGGDITYHGPGQLVGYPIFRLRDFPCGEDLHRFVRAIEEVLIRALAEFDIEAGRVEGKTGAWAGDKKIASIGLKCSRWVSMHGFALNVTNDLTPFHLINPCGLSAEVMTNMAQLGQSVSMDAVKEAVLRGFGDVFDCRITKA